MIPAFVLLASSGLLVRFQAVGAFAVPGQSVFPGTVTTSSNNIPCSAVAFQNSLSAVPENSLMSSGGGVSDLLESGDVVSQLTENPVTWSILIMLTIVGLLLAWETAIETAREEAPPAIRSVIDKILGEMGGLGFIGLVLSVTLHQPAVDETVRHLSEEVLGNEETLIESFEFLHEAFFQTGILFFGTAALVILQVIKSIRQISDMAEEAVIKTRAEGCQLVSEELAKVLGSTTLPAKACINEEMDSAPEGLEDVEAVMMLAAANSKRSAWQRELSLSQEERGAEALVIRERLLREMNLPENFRIETYIERVFATNKMDIVAISPASWIPLIPAIALANAVDLSHDVINSESINAAASSGFFYSTAWSFLPVVFLKVLSLVWGLTNFWKMAAIKSMLVPGLVLDESAGGEPRLLPPPVKSADLRRAFNSTPFYLRPIEALFGAPATNRVEELFGTVGSNGPAFYLRSIKFHMWLCVSNLVVFAAQILPRDLYALMNADRIAIGDPDHLVPELLAYGSFALLTLAQLAIIPTTFLNYCLITCVEDFVREDDVSCSIVAEMIEQTSAKAVIAD